MILPAPPTMPNGISADQEPLAKLILDAAQHNYELAKLRREEDSARDQRLELDQVSQQAMTAQLEELVRKLGDRVDDLGGAIREVTKSQAKLSVNQNMLRREFEVLRKELAAIHGRVAHQSDDMSDLRMRVEHIEHDLAELKQAIQTRDEAASTEPPPPTEAPVT